MKNYSSPFTLQAMTLRGIGPYHNGARLEFRPLTILCGENGTGKSTCPGSAGIGHSPIFLSHYGES